MSKVALRYLILNIITLIIAGLVLVFMMSQINKKGDDLLGYLQVRQEQEGKKESALMVQRLVQETQSERSKLAAAFFASESDSIQFLTEAERVANQAGLNISTEGLELGKSSQAGRDLLMVEITFAFSGRLEAVKGFLQYLETIPFHSKTESLSLSQIGSTDQWSARVKLYISIINSN